MKRITNYIIEKLNLTKNSKIIDSYSYEFFDGIKIDVPFDFFVTEKQDYVTISKIKYNAEAIFENWDFFEYDKKTNKYNLFVTLSKMGVKNIIMKNEQNARPLIKYFHGVKYNDNSSLEVCDHDKVVTVNENFNNFTGKIIKESNEQPKYADMIVLTPEEDSILILKRSIHNNLFKRKYGFPGGKVDSKDKNTKETAIRELKEETGIELTFNEQSKCKKYNTIVNKDGSITDYYIVTLEESRDIKLSNEHTSYKWYNGNVKVGFKWIPNVFQIIQKILD